MDLPWATILKEYGPLILVIVFFIYRDWQREIQLSRRIENLETYQKDVLKSLVEKTTVALVHSTECLKWIGRLIERLINSCPKMIGQDCNKPDDLD